jgi:prefoldin subunit 5
MEKLKNKLYSFQANLNEELHAQIKDERKKYDKTLLERNQEISRLKDQNQKLEQANQNLIKKLSEKDEDNCRLKIHNQSLLT